MWRIPLRNPIRATQDTWLIASEVLQLPSPCSTLWWCMANVYVSVRQANWWLLLMHRKNDKAFNLSWLRIILLLTIAANGLFCLGGHFPRYVTLAHSIYHKNMSVDVGIAYCYIWYREFNPQSLSWLSSHKSWIAQLIWCMIIRYKGKHSPCVSLPNAPRWIVHIVVPNTISMHGHFRVAPRTTYFVTAWIGLIV